MPGREHASARVPSIEDYVAIRQNGRFNGRYMAEHFNLAFVETVAEWMEEVIRVEEKKLSEG